jgi:hypothetical protein
LKALKAYFFENQFEISDQIKPKNIEPTNFLSELEKGTKNLNKRYLTDVILTFFLMKSAKK